MIKAANDNKPTRHLKDPFHRLYADGNLHYNEQTNYSLYTVGERYRRNFRAKPLVECDGYDSFRDRAIPDYLNPSKIYSDAAEQLDMIKARGLVEDILIDGMPIVEAGKKHTGRNHQEQARVAAITILTTALFLLRDHYIRNPHEAQRTYSLPRARDAAKTLAKTTF